jgi:hypothetical protein
MKHVCVFNKKVYPDIHSPSIIIFSIVHIDFIFCADFDIVKKREGEWGRQLSTCSLTLSLPPSHQKYL